MDRNDKHLALTAWSLLAVLCLSVTPSHAQGQPGVAGSDLHPHSEIVQAAAESLRARAPNADIEAQPLDPRLQLRRCGAALQTDVPLGVALTARINVRVRCVTPAAWSLIVPVTMSTEAAVWVANRPLRANEPLRDGDLRQEPRRFAGTESCCVRDVTEVLGKVLRRPVAAGTVIKRADIEIADAVKRGEIVTIVAGDQGFEVRASGVALGDAKPGEPVRIRHSSSLRIIQARADTQGVVRVP
jgi:flagella basal body P-ring formation protein FlgA